MLTDYQYGQFMDRLAEDQRGKNPLVLGEWENNFLASYRQSARPSLWFTLLRRKAAERMWMKWGGELGLPHPDDNVSEFAKIEADPNGCEFLVTGEDRRQRRCNEPAVCREPRRLRYCQAHREQVERAVKGTIFIPL